MKSKLPKSVWLLKLLEKKTNSYKFFFFISILNIIEKNNKFAALKLDQIIKEVLLISWYPAIFFKLNLGKQDQLSEILSKIPTIDVITPTGNFNDILIALIDSHFDDIDARALKTYVPYRFIRPFFEEKTRGMKDADVNKTITELSNLEFYSVKSIYKIDEQNDCIIFHDDWLSYLKNNKTMLKQWAYHLLALHLQKFNQNTPNIINKLENNLARNPLTQQRKSWNNIFSTIEINCPFSGNPINPENYHLDHYLPWNFVAHNQIWNLTPTTEIANLQKNNKLPSKEYFNQFVHNQKILFDFLRDTNNKKYLAEFEIDLSIETNTNLTFFKKSYTNTYDPLITIARNQGFTDDWSYLHQ
jgi:hypothetical protein